MFATVSSSSLPTNPKSSLQVYLLLLRLEARMPPQEVWEAATSAPSLGLQVSCSEVGLELTRVISSPAVVALGEVWEPQPWALFLLSKQARGRIPLPAREEASVLAPGFGTVVWASVPLPARRERDWHLQNLRRLLPHCPWQAPLRNECRVPVLLKEICPTQTSGIKFLDFFYP